MITGNCPFGPDEDCPNPDPNHLYWTPDVVRKHAKKVHHYDNEWLYQHNWLRPKITITYEALKALRKERQDCIDVAFGQMGTRISVTLVCPKIGFRASEIIIEKLTEDTKIKEEKE